MSVNKKFICLLISSIFGGASLLTGCTTPHSDPSQSIESSQTEATVKPGAAVEFSHEGPKDLQPGQYGKIIINVADSYEAGTLYLTAEPEEGLRLVSETAETDFSLSGRRTHEWELDVTSATDGVYYLNVFATVNLPDGTEFLRSYAAQIVVGDVTEAEISKSMEANGILSDDGKSIAMEAEETIQ